MIDYNLIKSKIEEIDSKNDCSLEDNDIDLFYEHIEYYIKNKDNEKFDEELIDSIYQILVMNTYYNIDDYPHVLEYIFKNSNSTPFYVFDEIRDYYEERKYCEVSSKYDKYLYKINYIIANNEYDMYGLNGGFQLVNMLFGIDKSILYMAEYSLKEKQPLLAFRYLLRFRRDELTQKWYHERTDLKTNDINKLFKKIFNKMNENYLNNKVSDELKLFLSYAYYYGIGTNIDIKKAKSLLNNLVLSNDNDIGIYENLKEKVDEDKRRITSLTINSKVNDLVSLGTYDFKNITWKILDKKDDKYLLLSNEILESNYIVNGQIKNGSFYKLKNKYGNITQSIWVKEIFKNDIKDSISDVSISKCFLLSKEDINKYLNTPSKRKAISRDQAIINGYDNYGVEADDNGYFPYLLESNYDDDVVDIVSSYGKIEKDYSYRDYIGIRPAMWVKIKK